MLLKSYQCMNLEGYFSEILSLQKTKLNECGILNLDSSSGDGTHWEMWFKKGKDKLYFHSCEVQPPTKLNAYLKSSPTKR